MKDKNKKRNDLEDLKRALDESKNIFVTNHEKMKNNQDFQLRIFRKYIGDGVYLEVDCGYKLKLTTEDCVSTIDEIYLEPEVIAALLKYIESVKELYCAS